MLGLWATRPLRRYLMALPRKKADVVDDNVCTDALLYGDTSWMFYECEGSIKLKLVTAATDLDALLEVYTGPFPRNEQK